MMKIERKPGSGVSKEQVEAFFAAKKALSLVQKYKTVNGNIDSANAHLASALKAFRKLNKRDKFFIEYVCTAKHRQFKEPIQHTFKYYPFGEESNLLLDLKDAKNTIRQKVVDYRKDLRSKNNDRFVQPNQYRDSASGQNFDNGTIAWTHTRPGIYSDILVLKKSKKIFEEKRPVTDKTHIGIELEFFCDLQRGELAAKFVKAGLIDYVTLKNDGSIKEYKSNQYPHEACIICPETEVQDIIKKVCTVLAEANAEVNKTCGMHVHLDMRNRDRQKVFSNLVSAQPILYAMNPKSRRDGTYCKPTKTKQFTEQMDRYHGINPAAYSKHRTIEVRIHSGTVNETKIMNWIKLLVSIANKKDEVKRAALSVKGFVKRYEIDADLEAYISKRVELFTSNTEVEEAA